MPHSPTYCVSCATTPPPTSSAVERNVVSTASAAEKIGYRNGMQNSAAHSTPMPRNNLAAPILRNELPDDYKYEADENPSHVV
jgi:hypothetical protein